MEASTAVVERKETPMDRFKKVLYTQSVQEQFKNSLRENAPLFTASLIELYGADSKLQKCKPDLVIMEALKAATLKLPINKNLGFAYIIPYEKSIKTKDEKTGKDVWTKVSVPEFQMGYKGYIQLAVRSAQYRHINADCIYEGETIDANRLTGEITIGGQKKSETVIGYFAHFETINGFQKTVWATYEGMESHAKRYSKAYSYDLKEHKASSPWSTEFDKMALKTAIRRLISKWGIMSVDMASAIRLEAETEESIVDAEIAENANTGPIVDVETVEDETPPAIAPEQIPSGTNGNGQTAVPQGPDW